MFFKQRINPRKCIVSLIGAGTRIFGDMRFHGDLHVDGEIHGNVCAADKSSTLVVSEHGLINGGARASYLILSGTIIGPVMAADRLELLPTARITGDVEYGDIEIPPGAVVEGRLICRQREPARSAELTNATMKEPLRLAKP